ncbi:hypothetical protein FOZ61_000009 [Perkinsus olseni]|uniref:Uncharacterized protein n=1 Tax=Perkinsus olseni TaxID=32597 RepID=A0A7J6MZP4_PEROL|nr:hypothetical protein FOZ61_000009 [Perkinsus olseni]KAF4676321.1 hypothetical protein FOL46_004922 [Perkinsus olseni]
MPTISSGRSSQMPLLQPADVLCNSPRHVDETLHYLLLQAPPRPVPTPLRGYSIFLVVLGIATAIGAVILDASLQFPHQTLIRNSGLITAAFLMATGADGILARGSLYEAKRFYVMFLFSHVLVMSELLAGAIILGKDEGATFTTICTVVALAALCGILSVGHIAKEYVYSCEANFYEGGCNI